VSDDPKMTAAWILANAMDPIYQDVALMEAFLDLAVGVVIEAFEENIISMPELVDSDRVPAEFFERFSSTYGGLYSRLVSDQWSRQALRHSMRIWKNHGSPEGYRMTYALFGFRIEMAEMFLDKGHWLTDHDLVYRRTRATMDDGGDMDDGGTMDDGEYFGYDIPAVYTAEFADGWWGKTSFYAILMLNDIVADGMYDDKVWEWLQASVVPLIEPVHARLINKDLLFSYYGYFCQYYGYWYGYGYGYGYDYGYAYGDWSFYPQGFVCGLNDYLGWDTQTAAVWAWDDGGDVDDGLGAFDLP